jgi:hypothetical protein
MDSRKITFHELIAIYAEDIRINDSDFFNDLMEKFCQSDPASFSSPTSPLIVEQVNL